MVRFRGLGFYHWAVRPALFSLDPERAHELTMSGLRRPWLLKALLSAVSLPDNSRLRQRVMGLPFENPLGLAAGLDKQATAVAAWAALGFGHAEIGTVTPRPQPGNPRPAIFRAPAGRGHSTGRPRTRWSGKSGRPPASLKSALFAATAAGSSSLRFPCLADAAPRTSWGSFRWQNLGPRSEQKWATLAPSAGIVSS